jgi:TRAP-type C4-dicarboxylate transport system substrate-binding protein
LKKLSYLFCILIISLLSFSLLISCSSGSTEPGQSTEPTQPSTTEKPAKTVTLRLTMAQPPMDPIATETMAMAEKFNERAGGSYVIEVYPAEQLAKYPETMDAVRTGAVEMADIGWGGFANSMITLTAAEMPFLYDSVEANAEVVAALPEILDEDFKQNLNIKALACHHVEGIELVGNKPVKELADWKNVKMAGATYYGPELAKVLGAAPVFVSYTEFYTSLQKGVVDAVFDSPTFTINGKVFEVIKYQTISMALGSSHGFIINLDLWNDMPSDIQTILSEETKAAAASISDIMAGLYYTHIEEIGKTGVEQFFIPAAERAKWKEALSSFNAEQEKLMGDIMPKIKQLAEEANKNHPYPY